MSTKRWRYCGQCGCRFDLNRGGYYQNSTGRYVCKTCVKTVNNASVRKHQSTGAMIAKIAFGAMFIATGFTAAKEEESPLTFLLVSLIIGIALIAWALVPYFQEKKVRQQEMLEEISEQQEEYNAPKTCKSCGATGTGDVCEYCGRHYE